SMASLEVLYEIKDKAKYVIASPGEVIANGMPYDKTVNLFFEKGDQAYVNIAQTYFKHYNEMDGLYRSATVSVIDMAGLAELAGKTKAILTGEIPKFPDYNRAHIQRMDFDRLGNPLIAFDFGDFMQQNFSDEAYSDLKNSMNSIINYKANTPFF